MKRIQFGWLWLVAAHICGCHSEDVPAGSGDGALTPPSATAQSSAVSRSSLMEGTPSTHRDVVAVVADLGDAKRLCSGVVLLPNLVLTARHCFAADAASIESGNCETGSVSDPPLDAVVHVIPGRDIDLVPAEEQSAVKEFLLPEDSGRLCGEDIVLLLLERPLDAEPAAVALAGTGNANGNTSSSEPTAWTAVGYGLFDGDWGQQRERSDVQALCVGVECADARIAANEFLASSGACEGDSGGPALDASGAVFAIAARSAADCSETAYLTLDSYRVWLKSALEYAASRGGFDMPAWTQAATNGSTDNATLGVSGSEPDLRARGGCSIDPATRHHGMAVLWLLALGLLMRRRHTST